jgi:hypothetical protein
LGYAADRFCRHRLRHLLPTIASQAGLTAIVTAALSRFCELDAAGSSLDAIPAFVHGSQPAVRVHRRRAGEILRDQFR